MYTLVCVLQLLLLTSVRIRRRTGCVSTRLCVLIVGRGRWLLERLSFPYAAVYHAGKMHRHGEGTGHNRGCVTDEGTCVRTRASDDEMGYLVVKGRVVADASARTSGLQHSSTIGSGLARFSMKPVHTIAALVKGRGHQIVANGVGQTAVEGPLAGSAPCLRPNGGRGGGTL